MALLPMPPTSKSATAADGKELLQGRFLQLTETNEFVDIAQTEKAVRCWNQMKRCPTSRPYALEL